jgi:hypothetical protein
MADMVAPGVMARRVALPRRALLGPMVQVATAEVLALVAMAATATAERRQAKTARMAARVASAAVPVQVAWAAAQHRTVHWAISAMAAMAVTAVTVIRHF